MVRPVHSNDGDGADGVSLCLEQLRDLQDLVRARMEQFPEYEVFLRHYGTSVLAMLEGESAAD